MNIKKAEGLVKKLNFEECIELYEKIPTGSPIIDLVFDRMENLDVKRFDAWI